MKRIIIAILALIPFTGIAQNSWEKPTETTQAPAKKKALFEKSNKNTDPKYLAGAVPVKDGKVVFELDEDVKGKSAQEIYDIVYNELQALTKEENQFKESQIAIVNKQDHVIAARLKEWLVFQNTFLSLDRTVFNYTIIATCADGHLNLKLTRISYQYELDREGSGLETTAEEWITDKYGLTKKQDKLSKYSGKFRRKTIDRKDYIFDKIKAALNA